MSLTFWHWFALGGGLLLLEVLTPGVVFLWLALAAGLTGFLLLLLPGLAWQWQVLSFAVAAVVTVGLSFRWRRRLPVAGGDPGLNRRALAYVGTEARAGAADRSRPRPGPDRRLHLAGRRSRAAGRHPRAGRRCAWCRPAGRAGRSGRSLAPARDTGWPSLGRT